MTRLTHEQKATIVTMLGDGKKAGEIAETLGLKKQTIHNFNHYAKNHPDCLNPAEKAVITRRANQMGKKVKATANVITKKQKKVVPETPKIYTVKVNNLTISFPTEVLTSVILQPNGLTIKTEIG